MSKLKVSLLANYSNFQSKNMKHDKDRTNIYEPDFNPTVDAKGLDQIDNFTKNLDKYIDLVSWCR